MTRTAVPNVLLLAIILSGFSMAMPVWATETWNSQTVDTSGALADVNCPIAVDSKNIAHVAYTGYTGLTNNDCYVMYATSNGSSFSTETVTAGVGVYSLVFDSSDNPHILFGNRFNIFNQLFEFKQPLSIAYWNGKSWTVQNTGIDNATYGTLALDSQGNPNIAYTIGNSIKYASWTGTKWNIQTVDTITDYSSKAPISLSLALDTNDVPYLLYKSSLATGRYQNIDTTISSIRFAKCKDSNWTVQNVSLPTPTRECGNIILDSTGNPHLICTQIQDIVSENRTILNSLLYASLDGSNWKTDIIASNLTIGSFGELKLDSQDNPNFCFTDLGATLNYVKYSQSTWKIYGSNVTAGAPCYLALDSSGTPHVSYRTYIYSHLISPIMYAIPIESHTQFNLEINMLLLIAIIAIIASITAIIIFSIRSKR
jgi:hypothetical protein